MQGPTVAGYMAKYSRLPAGAKTVRAATTLFEACVEFVLFDGDRSLIVADATGTALVPRPMLPAEQALLGGGQIERTNDSTAALVALEEDVTGSLSVAVGLDGDDQARLVELATKLAADLQQDASPTNSTFKTAVLDGLQDVIAVVDQSLAIRWVNDAVVTALGWTPDEMIGKDVALFIHPDDLAHTADTAAKFQNGQRAERLNLRLKSAFGRWVPFSLAAADHTANPEVEGLVLCLRNDEREFESERALDESRRVSSTILQNLHEAVVAADDVGSITIINDAARRLFSVSVDAAPGTLAIGDIKLLNADDEPINPATHPLRAFSNWEDKELRVATPRGLRNVAVSRTKVQLEEGRHGLVVTFHDMTQARTDARELRNRALHDQLTGLANRRFLSERLQAFQESDEQVRLAACFVDIDKFKNVNEVHGHRVGDAVLQATAQRLRSQIRDVDILGRLGSDEFLVVLVNPESEHSALDVAERIRRVFDRPFEVEGNRLHLTASVGVAFQEEDMLDDERLLQHADIALFAAKDRGRDRLEIFDQELATSVAVKQAQRNMVRDALDADGLVMHFQAIVDSAGKTIGVEALARCQDARGNTIAPAGFMDAIDGTNLLVRLDRAGFEQSCRLAAILAANPETAHIWVAANFAAITLAQSDFADVVVNAMDTAGVKPSSLCIEVTETAAFEPGETGIKALTQLHRAGLRIALDDFGTGYSSLSHLRDLPLTTVKIDRSFTSELHHHGAERAIASAVREIAESLGFNVVAEGVETAADKDAVHDIGVETMQGWYFARAVTQAELLKNLNIS